MAGLLDMLGGLSPEQNQGLLAAAAQMLQAGGPSRVPVGMGQALGAGLQAYQQSTEQARVRGLEERRQAQQDQFQQEYRTVQMDGLKSQKTERETKLKLEQARQEAVRKAIKPDGTLDNQALIANLAPFDPEGAMQIAKDFAPKPVTYGQPKELVVNGKPAVVVMGSDGQPKVLDGYSPYEAPKAARGEGSASGVGAFGKPPPGYRWTPEGNLSAIPGGPGEKLPESQQKQLVGVNNVKSAIAEYRASLKSFGGIDALNPDARAMMGTKYNNMMLQAKEAYNLGVLNGPDLQILQSVITDPASFKGAFVSKKALDAQASELDRMMTGMGEVSSKPRQDQHNANATRTVPNPVAPAGKIRKYNPVTGKIE